MKKIYIITSTEDQKLGVIEMVISSKKTAIQQFLKIKELADSSRLFIEGCDMKKFQKTISEFFEDRTNEDFYPYLMRMNVKTEKGKNICYTLYEKVINDGLINIPK